MSALFLIFHICYQHGVLPSQWTEGLVIALYKHKGDKHDVSNYRPITITSVVIRLLERLMLPTLKQYMHDSGIPCDLQFGFTALRPPPHRHRLTHLGVPNPSGVHRHQQSV